MFFICLDIKAVSVWYIPFVRKNVLTFISSFLITRSYYQKITFVLFDKKKSQKLSSINGVCINCFFEELVLHFRVFKSFRLNLLQFQSRCFMCDISKKKKTHIMGLLITSETLVLICRVQMSRLKSVIGNLNYLLCSVCLRSLSQEDSSYLKYRILWF